MRFLCDAMLGGLAKWLRAAGYDTYYARQGTDVSDRSLTRKALEEGARIAQLVLVRAAAAIFSEVEFLESATDGRGEAGFGSSGS